MRYIFVICLSVIMAGCTSMSRKVGLEENALEKLQLAIPIGTNVDDIYAVATRNEWNILSDNVQSVWLKTIGETAIERELILYLGWRPGIPFSFNVYAHIAVSNGRVFDYYVNAEANAL